MMGNFTEGREGSKGLEKMAMLTPKEAGERYRVPLRQVMKAVDCQQVGYCVIGGRILIPGEEMEAWFRRLLVKPHGAENFTEERKGSKEFSISPRALSSSAGSAPESDAGHSPRRRMTGTQPAAAIIYHEKRERDEKENFTEDREEREADPSSTAQENRPFTAAAGFASVSNSERAKVRAIEEARSEKDQIAEMMPGSVRFDSASRSLWSSAKIGACDFCGREEQEVWPHRAGWVCAECNPQRKDAMG